MVASAAHRALAREVAARSMVLLRNEPVDGGPLLPLDAARCPGSRSSAGWPTCRTPATTARPTSARPTSSRRSPGCARRCPGSSSSAPTTPSRRGSRAGADAAVVVVGYTAEDEGEYVGSFDPELAELYPPSDDPDALAELARVWDAGPQSVGGDRDSLRLHPRTRR